MTRILLIVTAFLFAVPLAQAALPPDEPATLDQGFSQMYNLNFPAAHKAFETWQQLHPEDPMGAAANASAYLFSEFERLHILELDLFTDSQKLDNLGKTSADPGVKAAFDAELTRADEIAQKVLAE